MKANVSNPWMGGEDIDNTVVELCAQKFEEETGINCRGNSKAMRRLKNEVEKVKRLLSDATQAEIELDALTDGEDFSYSLTRKEFEQINQKYFDECIPMIEDCIA